MPTSLYVDSMYATCAEDGGSYNLNLGASAIELKPNTKVYIDDVVFNHNFDSVIEGASDRLWLLTRWNAARNWGGDWEYVNNLGTFSELNQSGKYFTSSNTTADIPIFDGVTFNEGAVLDADATEDVEDFGLSGLPDLTGVVFTLVQGGGLTYSMAASGSVNQYTVVGVGSWIVSVPTQLGFTITELNQQAVQTGVGTFLYSTETYIDTVTNRSWTALSQVDPLHGTIELGPCTDTQATIIARNPAGTQTGDGLLTYPRTITWAGGFPIQGNSANEWVATADIEKGGALLAHVSDVSLNTFVAKNNAGQRIRQWTADALGNVVSEDYDFLATYDRLTSVGAYLGTAVAGSMY